MKHRLKKFCSLLLILTAILAFGSDGEVEFNPATAAADICMDASCGTAAERVGLHTARYTELTAVEHSDPVLAGPSDIVSARQYIQFKYFQRLPAVLACAVLPLVYASSGAAILKYSFFSPCDSQFFRMLTAQRGKDGKK